MLIQQNSLLTSIRGMMLDYDERADMRFAKYEAKEWFAYFTNWYLNAHLSSRGHRLLEDFGVVKRRKIGLGILFEALSFR